MHCFARKHLGCYVLIAATVLGIARPAPAATGEQINAAINRAKDWLYKQEHDGNWEEVPAPMGSVGSDLRGLQWGGSTAIAVYALLAAGESRNDPRLVQAIEFLKKTELRGTYAVALRCQVWQLLASDRELRPLIEADASLMLGGMYSSGPHAGMFAYGVKGGPQPPGYFDHSVSQYGVLGLWALEQAGANIPVNNWRLIDQGWRADQHSDGGWSYSDSAALPLHQGSTASMTAAGLASLFIAQDYLQMDSPICRTVVPNENIDRALHWMDQNIDTIIDNPGSYTMYGIERIGTASGRKYFATKPWYDRGVDLLLSHQSEHGSWGLVHDTCFSLLFLVRGRAPIMMNKLQYEVNGITPGVAYEGPWNERPRDLANFARWLSRDLERDLNWQIVNLKVAPDDLSDAPVLYIGGSDELRLSDESANHLREFVEQGGLILGNPDCEKEPFIEGFKALGRRLFPHYEFRELEPSHPIFTNEQYPSVNWKERPSVLGLSNGVRELMILAPHADLGRYWQLNREKGHELPYQLGANIFLYAIDKSDLRFRSTSRVVQANNGRAAANEIRLARIQAGDNPDPEPGGWRRLTAIMHNEDSVDIETAPVKLDAESLRGFKIAHLTGTTTLQLTDDQRKALSAFVADGGTLIVEAAGGSLAFADSAQAQLQRTFGDEAAKALANPLLPIDPLYSKTQARISEVSYRSFLHPSLKGDLKSPRLRAWNHNGHMAVIFSREDISGGLVGEPVDGIRGYSPQSATDLMRAILLYASGINPS